MTKQEEIKGGIDKVLWEGSGPGHTKCGDILLFLHSQGVVIYKPGHRESNFDDEIIEPLIKE